MTSGSLFWPRGQRRRLALSMVEVAISILIVGTVLVAALNAVGATVASRQKLLWQVQGQQLARALLSEILPLPYQDPSQDPNVPTLVLGCEADETATDRATFDDVDDYNGYQQTPPQALDESALTNEPTWSWSVIVEWVDPLSPGGTAVSAESHAKRITVTVTRDKMPVATLVGLRTDVDQ
jgi:Tfp pilus assembly protein PilV